jgi:hypothetical protein
MAQMIEANPNQFVGVAVRTADVQGESGAPDMGVLQTPAAAVIKALFTSGI